MKIDKLHIRSRFKNLETVQVDFDEKNLMTVIVGRNGSGKSNVVEALVAIFRNLDLGEAPPFSYFIRYKLGSGKDECWVEVDADPNRGALAKQHQVTVSKGSKSNLIPFSTLKRDRKTGKAPYLPNYLFAYYSGPSDRLENYFRAHRTDFYTKLLYGEVNLKGNLRPLFYAKPFHSQFVLLAFFLSKQNNTEKQFLMEQLGIKSLDSVHFVMRKPAWSKSKDELFWGAFGVVRQFLDRLYPYTLAPIKIMRQEDTTLTGSKVRNEFFHLFLPDIKALRAFAKGLTPDVFFKMLESTLLSEIISEVNVRVNVTYSKEPLTFRELSEGEQQLLTVLGLLKFTGGRDSLFLLDEPDTHLNPSWAVNYLKYLREFVPDHKTSHLLMVTHHPMTIAELEKEQVQVMKREDTGEVTASMPEESPRGMGVNLILRSDMFGLETTLDDATNRKLTRRNALACKDKLSAGEVLELERINEEVDLLGFNTSSDDPDYTDFLQQKYHSKAREVSTCGGSAKTKLKSV